MNSSFLKLLLEIDIRLKNAVSLLTGLVAVVATYFLFSQRSWFQEFPGWGQVASLAIVLLITFLTVWLIWTGGCTLWNFLARHKHAQRMELESDQRIRDILYGLSAWQIRFLLRFVRENRTQIPEWEIGQYRAAWDFELDVLIRKGIIISHRRGMYEIVPKYLNYLREHWDPVSDDLY